MESQYSELNMLYIVVGNVEKYKLLQAEVAEPVLNYRRNGPPRGRRSPDLAYEQKRQVFRTV